jgi:hypothetical protein
MVLNEASNRTSRCKFSDGNTWSRERRKEVEGASKLAQILAMLSEAISTFTGSTGSTLCGRVIVLQRMCNPSARAHKLASPHLLASPHPLALAEDRRIQCGQFQVRFAQSASHRPTLPINVRLRQSSRICAFLTLDILSFEAAQHRRAETGAFFGWTVMQGCRTHSGKSSRIKASLVFQLMVMCMLRTITAPQ